MAQFPTSLDSEFNLLQKLVSNTGDLAAGGGGGGSGTVTSVTSANANIGITNTTTTPVLTLASALTLVNSITATAATDLTLNAGSGNQNVVIAPTGTGYVKLGPSSLTNPVSIGAVSNATAYGAIIFNAGTTLAALQGIYSLATDALYYNVATGNAHVWRIANQTKMQLSTGGNLLLGGLTSDGTGVLQFPAATTNAGGITMGDVFIFRSGTGITKIGGASLATIDNAGSVSSPGNISAGAQASVTASGSATNPAYTNGFGNTGMYFSGSNGNLLFSTAGATALTLDSSQNATFAKNISVSGTSAFTTTARASGTANYFTVNIPADTGITAATESIGYQHVTATRTWATTGTVALQRENFFAGPTYASASASQTFTDPFTLYLTPPVAGTNAIFTRGHTLGIVDATSAASSITGGLIVATTLGTAATSVGIGGGNINAGGLITGGTMTSTGQFTASSTSTFTGAITQTAKTAKYNNITTAGWGQPAIYASARSTAQVAAVASVATYTVGAADGTFIVAANVNVTAATTATFSATVTYLDENNTSRTATFSFVQNGVALPIQSITNVTGIGAYAGNPMMIRCKAATVITIATSGTFTSVTYNVEGFIEQVA